MLSEKHKKIQDLERQLKEKDELIARNIPEDAKTLLHHQTGQIKELQSRLKEAEEIIKPFAVLCEYLDAKWFKGTEGLKHIRCFALKETKGIFGEEFTHSVIHLDWIQRAKQFLNRKEEGK